MFIYNYMNNKIYYIDSDNILFRNMKGKKLVDMQFLNKVCNINCKNYDKIYKLDDGWTGGYLLLKNNTFRLIMCGSGKPIISDTTGNLI